MKLREVAWCECGQKWSVIEFPNFRQIREMLIHWINNPHRMTCDPGVSDGIGHCARIVIQDDALLIEAYNACARTVYKYQQNTSED